MKLYKERMTMLFYLTLIFVITNSVRDKLANNAETTLSCALRVIQEFFSADETINFVTGQLDELEFLEKLKNPRVIVNNFRPEKYCAKPEYNNFVILHGPKQTLSEIFSKLQEINFWHRNLTPRGKFLLIAEPDVNLTETFQTLWYFDIIRAMVLVNDAHPYLCNYRPFSAESNCGKTTATQCSSRCDIRALEKIGVITDFQKCELKIVLDHHITETRPTPPFKVYFKTTALISKYLNVVMREVVTKFVEEALYNRSMGLSLTLLGNKVYDLLNIYEMSSYGIYRSRLVWIVPKPTKIPDVLIITLVFNPVIWAAISAVFLTEVVTWYAFTTFAKRHTDDASFFQILSTTYQLTLGGSTNVSPKTYVIRYVFLFYALYCINIYCMFQANLINILTEPKYEKGITSVNDLIDSNISIISYKYITRNFFPNVDEETYLKLSKQFVFLDKFNRTDDLVKISKYRNCSMYILKDTTTIRYPVDIVEDDTFTSEFNLMIYSRKGFYLMDSVNRFLNRLFETGVYNKILTDSADAYYSGERDADQNVKLTIYHLMGAFVVCGIGQFLAFLSFVGETLVFRYYNVKNGNRAGRFASRNI